MQEQKADRLYRCCALAGVLLLAHGAAAAEDLTLEWILDHGNTASLGVPRFVWLPDETLLIDDHRKPQGERLLERLDPATLERKPLAGQAEILEAWKAAMAPREPPRRLGLPSAVSSKGLSLYQHGGDIYLVDLMKAAAASGGPSPVRRVTNTEAAESSPRFSPDGRFIAYVRDADLHAADTSTGAERRLTRDGTADRLNGKLSWVYWEEITGRRDEAYWWSPDSSRILYLQTDETPVGRFPIVSWSEPGARVEWQRYPKSGAANPAVRAGIVDLAGSDTRWIDLGSPPPEYIARAGWLPGGEAVAIQTMDRTQSRLRLWVAPAAGPVDRDSPAGEPRLALEESAATYLNLHDDLHFLPGGERFLWLSEKDGFRHLYLCAVAGGAWRPVTSGSWPLRSAGHDPPGCVAWLDPAAETAYFHAARPTSLETQLHRARLDGGGLARLTEGEGSHRATFSPAGRFFVDEYSRAATPPRLTLHRKDGTLLSVIASSAADRLERFRLEPPVFLEVAAGDGTLLPAKLLRPSPLREGRKHPAIVHVYGGPGSPAVADRWEGPTGLWAQLLAQRGFAVLTIDPRSSMDRGKKLEETAFRRFYGGVELEDILCGVRHLKSQPFIDPARVGIWGWSGGGTTTLNAMTRSKEFRAGIAVAGVTDWRYYDTVYTERYMRLPRENEDGYRSSSVANAAGDLHGRLLLVHGTADDNVHLQNALRYVEALIAAGKQFELMLYPGRDHGIGDPAARRHLFRLMLDFWERELRGPREF
jgi:dipeptidyl-peptidase-4